MSCARCRGLGVERKCKSPRFDLCTYVRFDNSCACALQTSGCRWICVGATGAVQLQEGGASTAGPLVQSGGPFNLIIFFTGVVRGANVRSAVHFRPAVVGISPFLSRSVCQINGAWGRRGWLVACGGARSASACAVACVGARSDLRVPWRAVALARPLRVQRRAVALARPACLTHVDAQCSGKHARQTGGVPHVAKLLQPAAAPEKIGASFASSLSIFH